MKLQIQFIILFSETQGKTQKRCDLDNEITPFSDLISVMAVAVVTAGGNAVLLRVIASCRMTTVVMICFHAIQQAVVIVVVVRTVCRAIVVMGWIRTVFVRTAHAVHKLHVDLIVMGLGGHIGTFGLCGIARCLGPGKNLRAVWVFCRAPGQQQEDNCDHAKILFHILPPFFPRRNCHLCSAALQW